MLAGLAGTQRVDFQIDARGAGHSAGMQLRLGGLAGRGRLFFSLTSALALAAACGKSDQQPSSEEQGGGIFGGTGGGTSSVPLAGKAGSASGGAGGTAGSMAAIDECASTPPGKLALIDNFDDGNSIAAFEPGREAYWFTIHDESPGTIEPPKDFVGSPDGYLGTASAHVRASGFTTWGAALVSNISYKQTLRCPYNASAFQGLSFVARGGGRVRVQVIMPGVTDKEYGGTCDPDKGQVCYDNHGVEIDLTPEFKTYELSWSSFQQRGYGTQVPFDPKTIFALQFAMEPVNLPVDLWVDELQFWDGVRPPDDGVAGASAGGAGSEAGGAAAGASDRAGMGGVEGGSGGAG
ncbi:MAG TPA: hypothetical protein VHB79_31295 [Polyangiaceae bacterium]|nr:hypothetical protein [Polyangiaceae bacterium]